jgi:hypothetical protein
MKQGLSSTTALVLLLVACKPSSSSVSSSPTTERIKVSEIASGPLKREKLSAQQVERIQKLQTLLAEVDNSSLEKWLEDFKHDEDPDREITIFEAIAQAYVGFCDTKSRTLAQKEDAFALLLERSGTTDDEALKHHKLKILTLDEAREVLGLYKTLPMPILVRKR